MISDLLRKWLKGQIFGFCFIAVLTAVALLILGMPLVLTLALIAGLLNLIPNFGPIIAFIPAALLGLMQGNNSRYHFSLYIYFDTGCSKRRNTTTDTKKDD